MAKTIYLTDSELMTILYNWYESYQNENKLTSGDIALKEYLYKKLNDN